MALSGRQKVTIFLAIILGGFALVGFLGYSSFKSITEIISKAGDEDSPHFDDDKKGNVAVLEIKGMIDESKKAIKSLDELEERDSVKAIVLRIDSPGGAVGPTQEVLERLLELRAKTKKKIICSFGDLAASGAYYIAMACDKIYANPGSIVGSIGVIMQFANIEGLYKWARVEPIVIKAGKFKDVGSPLRPMKPEERELLQSMLDEVHAQFKGAVEKGRGFKPGYINEYGDGRVFSGEKAKELGFVDELGGESVAIESAAKAAGIKGKPKVLREILKRDRMSRWLESDSESQVAARVETLAAKLVPSLGLRPGVMYMLPSYLFSSGAELKSLGR